MFLHGLWRWHLLVNETNESVFTFAACESKRASTERKIKMYFFFFFFPFAAFPRFCIQRLRSQNPGGIVYCAAVDVFSVPQRSPATRGARALWKLMSSSAKSHTHGYLTSWARVAFSFAGIAARFRRNPKSDRLLPGSLGFGTAVRFPSCPRDGVHITKPFSVSD